MSFWFGASWVYLVWGVLGLIGAFALSGSSQRWAALVLGIVAILLGLYGFVRPGLWGVGTADSIVLILLGLWGIFASWKKEAAM